MRKAHDKQNIADAQHAPDGKHHRHRHKGLAGAAADGGYCVGIGQQKEEQRNGPGLLCGKRDMLAPLTARAAYWGAGRTM